MNKINAGISIFKVFRQIKKNKILWEKQACWLAVTRYWLLDTGYWLLVAGYWLLVTGCWLLVTGYCQLPIGFCQLPVTSYRHSQEYLLPAIMISSFASIAIRAASQYSVSGPSDIGGPPAASYVTSLHTLHVPSASHALKAIVISMNDMASMILRRIVIFLSKVAKAMPLSPILFKNVIF